MEHIQHGVNSVIMGCSGVGKTIPFSHFQEPDTIIIDEVSADHTELLNMMRL